MAIFGTTASLRRSVTASTVLLKFILRRRRCSPAELAERGVDPRVTMGERLKGTRKVTATPMRVPNLVLRPWKKEPVDSVSRSENGVESGDLVWVILKEEGEVGK